MGTMDQSKLEAEKKAAAVEAVKFIKNGNIVGLGTGSTATYAIKALSELVKDGLAIKAVASSIQTEELAKSLGIEMLNLGSVAEIDISIDGADEFDASLNLIKGGGGALFREKIMASMSKLSIIVTDSSKKVDQLGAFKVPIEVFPLAHYHILNSLKILGGTGVLRVKDGQNYLTDNNNYIIDTDFGLIENAETLSKSLNQIVGLVAHGLFIGLTSKVIMSKGAEIIVFE